MPPEVSTGRRWFELTAQVVVLYSVVVFYMESELSVPGSDRVKAGFWLWNERALLILFSAEYIYRWARAKNRLRHPFTLLAVVDLLAIGPSMVGPTLNFRALKLLRILPLLWMLKLYRYNNALQNVLRGFRKVGHELAVVGFVAIVVLFFSAAAMHEFEHQAQPEKFGRLSDSLWWSFVTLTTVGYGDSFPITGAGRAVAVVTMLVGIGVLGTFISLVGTSFLATMGKDEQAADTAAAVPMIEGSRQIAAPWIHRRAG